MAEIVLLQDERAVWKRRANDIRRHADRAVDSLDKEILLKIAQAMEQLSAAALTAKKSIKP